MMNYQDPSALNVMQNLSNPAQKEHLEAQIAKVQEDPELKAVLDEIKSGGPSAMMKWVVIIIHP